MKKIPLFLSFAVLWGVSSVFSVEPAFRQTYKLDPGSVKSNAQKVSSDLEKASQNWKNASAVYYVVPAMGSLKCMPDIYPAEGKFLGALELIATKGEFEPASFVMYPRANVNKFELKASDLKGPSGATIPASAIDLKIVKLWYQGGGAWYGYYADSFKRVLVPELLLNDENLIKVDCDTEDNYVRYKQKNGKEDYHWMSFYFGAVGYKLWTGQANIDLIEDAETLQPVVLNKDEFKQFFVTVKVPSDAAPGVYTGKIDMIADGKTIGNAPVELLVLPFELPQPLTNYNLNKNFYLVLYGVSTRYPKIIKNLVDHNALTGLGAFDLNAFDPADVEEQVNQMKELGHATKPIFAPNSASTGGWGIAVWGDRMSPTPAKRANLEKLRRNLAAVSALTEKFLGHREYYSYGIDEGGADTIRAQRPAWKIAQDVGGKMMVTTRSHEKLLMALDFMVLPGMPKARREHVVKKFHEANPESLTAWYANPHSGPENPDYFRRLHGLQAYKMDYDVNANYCWWRNNWNDFAAPYEPEFRGLIMVYGQKEDVLDTIAWEGVREGMDDIRYATKMKLLAAEAVKSSDVDTKLLGKNALNFLAYADEERENLDFLRLEIIRYILQLDEALKGRK